MRLRNGERAIVDLLKLTEYCLNPDSPRGRHKARVFAAALGLTTADATVLCDHLLEAARNGEAVVAEIDTFGERFTIDFQMTTAAGRAVVRSAWIIRHGESTPRLTTCFVKKFSHE